MNEHDKQVSGVETTANSAPSQGRRRLVKGAMLATPAVMTLMSGRLMAAASMNCLQKAGDPTEGWIDADGNVLVYKDPKNGNYTLGYYTDDGQGNRTFHEAILPVAPSPSCAASLNP